MRLSIKKQFVSHHPQIAALKMFMLFLGAAWICCSLSYRTKPKQPTTDILITQVATWDGELSPSSSELTQNPDYIGPCELASDVERGLLYVAQIDTPAIAVIDVETDQITRRIDLRSAPTGLCLSPTGTTLYVTCEGPPVMNEEAGEMRQDPQGVVRVIDTATGETSDMIRVGCGARGPCVSPDGTTLYVCNRFDNDLSIVDLVTRQEVRRVPCLHEPFDSVITPDGETVFVSNRLPNDPSDAYDVASEITVINAETLEVSSIRLLNGATCMANMCVSPDGKYLYVVGVLARYQFPGGQVSRIWISTNALSIIDVERRELVTMILLDNVYVGAADPYDVVVSEDGSELYVSHAGSQELMVINAAAMHEKIAALPKDKEELTARLEAAGWPDYDSSTSYSSATLEDIPNDLAFLEGLGQRIRLPGKGPRGLGVFGDDVFIAIYFSDSIVRMNGIASLDKNLNESYDLYIDDWWGDKELIETKVPLNFRVWPDSNMIALGETPVLAEARRGEMLFQDATICYENWYSCATCHPDGRVDGLNYDLYDDGCGNPKNVSSMVMAHESEPSGWRGVRQSFDTSVAAKVRHVLWSIRSQEDLDAIMAYIRSLEPAPSPHYRYDEDGRPLRSVAAGRALFESEEVGCATCHPAPIYTDNQSHDVGSRSLYDRVDEFYTPSLVECWRTGPYLHDGRYLSIRELLIEGNHGNTADTLTEEEIEELILYVLTR
jgi:YVTN family beta-propeller protein